MTDTDPDQSDATGADELWLTPEVGGIGTTSLVAGILWTALSPSWAFAYLAA